MEHRDITPIIAEVQRSYRYHRPPDLVLIIQKLIERAILQVLDWLNAFRMHPVGSTDSHSVATIMQIVWLCAGALCVVAIVYLVYRRLTQISAQSALAKRGPSASEALLDAAAWRRQAAEFSNNSQYKEACRAVYFSFLRQLHERKIMEFMPTRTNYEYFYALNKYKTLAAKFRTIADIVEACWFGKSEAGNAEYERCVQLLDEAEIEMNEFAAKEAAKAGDR